MARNTIEDLGPAVEALKSADTFGFDFETTGFNPHTDRIKGVSWSVGTRKDQSWYFRFLGPDGLSQVQVFREIQPVLLDPKRVLCGSGLKFELKFGRANGLIIENFLGDTVIGDWMGNENNKEHGLKEVCEREFNVDMMTYKQAVVFENDLYDKERFDQYAKDDAKYARKLWLERIAPRLVEDDLMRAYSNIEMPLIRVLADMEFTGIKVDVEYLRDYSRRLKEEIVAARERAVKLVGRDFDPGSPQQVSIALFDWLALPPQPGMVRGKNGFYSTDDDVLKAYRKAHPAGQAIVDFRKPLKLDSTYAQPLAERGEKDPGHRVYPSFKQHVAVTGRLSSEDPNAQNMPTKPNSVRKAFIAPPGKVLLDSDFNQIEFRIAGHFALHFLGWSNIADAYLKGMDLHDKTVKEMGFESRYINLDPNSLEYKSKKKEARRDAKIINFGFIYGRGAPAFADENDLPLEQAKDWKNRFHNSYPELRKMRDICAQMIYEQGYITTLTNRRRRFPEWKGVTEGTIKKMAADEGWTEEMTERKRVAMWWNGWVAWNSLVQGGAADYVKVTMRNLWREINKRRVTTSWWNEVFMLLQVHDELVLEVPEEHAVEVKDVLEDIGSKAMTLKVGIKMESKIVKNWEEAL